MTIQRLWFVLPLDMHEDDNRPRINPQQEIQQDIEAPPLRQGRRELGRPGAIEAFMVNQIAGAPQPIGNQQRNNGYGFHLTSASRKELDIVFTSAEMAEAHAKERAEREPKRPFGVFSCQAIYETTTPTVIEKEFNNAGELRVKGT